MANTAEADFHSHTCRKSPTRITSLRGASEGRLGTTYQRARARLVIFRRLRTHIQDENWFAVFIDFCIVVIGVFVGIQVANWNASVDLRRQQKAAIDGLLEESRAIILAIQQEDAVDASAVATMKPVVEAISERDTASLTGQLIARSVGDARRYRNVVAPRATYDALTGSGVLSSMADDGAIKAVATYYASVDAMQNATELFQYFIIAEYPKFADYEGVQSLYDESEPSLRRYEVDVEASVGSETAREDAVSLLRNRVAFMGIRQIHLARAREMCEALAKAAEQDCDVIEEVDDDLRKAVD